MTEDMKKLRNENLHLRQDLDRLREEQCEAWIDRPTTITKTTGNNGVGGSDSAKLREHCQKLKQEVEQMRLQNVNLEDEKDDLQVAIDDVVLF